MIYLPLDMPFGLTKFESKGVCIYCSAAGVELTDEHIVPYSLGGAHVIRAASCHACADITKRFEQKVARDLWGDARTSFNASSRRKKDRKDFILMPDSEKPGEEVKIQATEYSAAFVFYKMGVPGILQGLHEDVDVSDAWRFVIIDDDARRKQFLESNAKKLVIRFRHVPQDFGRLLCKIAYGQLLTVLDLSDFNPICLPYIMGQKENVSHVVGGSLEDPPPTPGIGYSLETTGLISASITLFLIVTIRLYANTHAPAYQVVAGEVIGESKITRIIKKLR